MKRFLAASLCVVVALGGTVAIAGCNNNSTNGKDYSEDIAELQQQIQELEDKNNSLQSEVDSLKNNGNTGESKDYTAEINSLKQQIKNLETKLTNANTQIGQLENDLQAANTQISNANTQIGQLENDLQTAKLRLDAVEGAMQADKNYTYKMGDVCTVKSASGIELYKIRLIKYELLPGDTIAYRLHINLQRLNLPSYLSLNQFVNIALYDEDTDSFGYQFRDIPDTTDNFEQVYIISFSAVGFPSSRIPSHFYVGLPWDNDFPEAASRQYIIPYAIFENQ